MVIERLRALFLAESDRWVLWVPVGFGTGIGFYFAAPAPASAVLAAACAVAALALLAAGLRLRGWRPGAALALLALASVLAGLAAAGWRVASVAAPVITREGTHALEARVAAVELRPPGARLILDQAHIERLAAEDTPRRLRVTVRTGAEDLVPGDLVRLRARLYPPRPPGVPGAFDYGRHAWFESLGAVGFAYGTPERIGRGEARSGDAVAWLRAAIARRVTAVAPGEDGAVAAALITGMRAGIGEATWTAMQRSGLAHLLSISGLHMALVAGTLFLFFRWTLSLMPPLVLRVPARKPAALAAMAGASFYLLLSGATVPTQRSWAMIMVALLAVLADRNPFSMRLLAAAAMLVLLLRPESLAGASFQLSFAAVLALIAAYESGLGSRLGGRHSLAMRALRYLLGVLATTLVASAATAPFTAYHFQTISTFGVLANLVAVPVTSFWVMPAALLAVALMPLGLEQPVLLLMVRGVELVLQTAHGVAALPGAAVAVPQWPLAALLLFVAGGLWVCLWRKSWRWLGLAPCLVAALLAVAARPPALMLDPMLDMAALRDPRGGIAALVWHRDRSLLDDWQRAAGAAPRLLEPAAARAAGDGATCDEAGCLVESAGVRILLARRPDAVLEDCARVDLVIARFRPVPCSGPQVVDGRALYLSQGLAVSTEGGRVRISTVAGDRAGWPWAGR
ncbi:ComEC/Rec2 family competence protein [Geminicoccaceae bacterium 1502E]|nr:ComEC/Rec2 family competence protein [Geminicoccaceae bacterium 1502E]